MDPGVRHRIVRGGRGVSPRGRCDADVVVANRGGPLRVQIEGDETTLSGPVQFVANVGGSKFDLRPHDAH